MTIDSIFTTGALLTAAGSLVYYLKGVPNIIFIKIKRQLVYTATIYEYSQLFGVLESYLYKNHISKYRDVEVGLNIENNSNNPHSLPQDNTEYSLVYKQEETIFVIKYNGKKLFIQRKKERLDKATNIKEIHFSKYTISGWGAKKSINEFLEELLNNFKSSKKDDRIAVYKNNTWGEFSLMGRINVKPLDKIYLAAGVKENIIEDINKFTKSKEWYHSLGIPYNRGYLFYGLPGNGKTSISLAMASHLKKDVYCININNLESDQSLYRCFSFAPIGSIILIEDIDASFNGRESLQKKVSFSTLLNCINGAGQKEGNIVIITTNHIDKLDPALIRPGRIDIKIELLNPSTEDISRYISDFYGIQINIRSLPKHFSMSEIQELCISNRDNPEFIKNYFLSQELKAI